MADEPTPRELLIQVHHLAGTVASLTTAVEQLRSSLASAYVPRGEWVEARKADDRRIGDVEKDIETQAGFRRQVAAGAIVGILLLVANLVVTLARIPGTGA